MNSTVGVLTQFMPLELNSYMGNGNPWDLDRVDGGLTILPPYTAGKRVNGIKELQMPFIRILNILNNMIQNMF